jgi:hypothetical protein
MPRICLRSLRWVLLSLAAVWIVSCSLDRRQPASSIVFSEVPPAADGGPERMARIAGRVNGVHESQRIVLFAKSGVWYVQPYRNESMTTIQPDGAWSSSTHLGSEYAALLVRQGYQPPPTTQALPVLGGEVLASATVRGTGDAGGFTARTIDFSGYRWDVRQRPSERGGYNQYSAGNVRVDDAGALHLAVNKTKDGVWKSAEITLTRSFGYGTYSFVLRALAALDPAVVLTFFTYDESGPPETYREMDIQLQRESPSAPIAGLYVVQPYYVAANSARFTVPAGPATYTLRWEPGRVAFVAAPGRRFSLHVAAESEHEFTVGVPTPGQERIGINLSYVRKSPVPPHQHAEVIIERVQYLP